jgi:hypothetical protein
MSFNLRRTAGCLLVGITGCMILFTLWIIYDWLTEDAGRTTIVVETYYAIDVSMIPNALDDPGFLKPLPSDIQRIPTKPDATPVRLSADDFYAAARRISEDWDNLYLNGVTFRTPCEFASLGPQRAAFRLIEKRGVLSDTLEVHVTVDALNAGANLWAMEIVEPKFPWRRPRGSIDWAGIKVQMSEALEIAEAEGGRAFREAIGNDCRIAGFLQEPVWAIEYLKVEESTASLTFEIDILTGEVRMQNSK